MALLASLPPWPLVEEMLRTLVLPAFLAAGAVLALVCALSRSERVRTAGAAAALLVGLAAGNHFHHLLDWCPASLQRGWRVLLPVVAGVTSAATLLGMLPARAHWSAGPVLRVLVAAAGTWLILEALAPLTATATYGLLLTCVILNWEISRLACSRLPRRGTLPVLAVLWGGAAAALLIFAHSARFCDLAVLLTASLVGVGIAAAVWKLDLTFLLAAPCVFIPGLLLAGAANTYSEVPCAAFAWAAIAPAALLPLCVPLALRLPAPVRIAIAMLSLLLPCAAGVIMAARVESLDYGE